MVSSTFSIKAIATFLSIISATNAHMIMKSPIPYGRGSINNSPLANDGSDFPCKGIFDMTDPTNDVNHLVPGVANTLSFTGSAVHGGGSCQVSLTTDLKPTKNSKWMVIKSIEGGCPANVDGNLPADPNGNGASTFQYTVPAGFTPGQYTIAWTWFNRIGNREMYMNCGRASIANSKKRYAPAEPKALEQRATSFPDLFTANLAIFTCGVAEGTNVKFPNPGADVQVTGTVTPPSNCGASSGDAGTGSGSGSGSGSAASSAVSSVVAVTSNAAATSAAGGFASGNGAATSQAAATTVASGSNSRPSVSPGNFASGAASQSAPAASQSAPAATTATVAPTAQASSVAQPTAQPTANAGSGSGTSTGSTTPGTACSEEGAWLCASGGLSFQRCASGRWSASMQVASGTTCTPGQSMNLSMKVVSYGSRKRDVTPRQHRKRVLPILS